GPALGDRRASLRQRLDAAEARGRQPGPAGDILAREPDLIATGRHQAQLPGTRLQPPGRAERGHLDLELPDVPLRPRVLRAELVEAVRELDLLHPHPDDDQRAPDEQRRDGERPDEDPPGARVVFTMASLFVRHGSRSSTRSFPHGGDEIAGRAERAPPHDRAGDPPRVPLLAVLDEDPRELGLGQPIHELRRSFAARGIEAHVERLILLEREAAPRRLELVGRHAEVEQDRARTRDAVRLCRGPEVAERFVREAHAIAEAREPRSRVPQCVRAHVESQEPDRRRARHQERLGVTAHSHRRIDHPSLAARSQEKRDFVDEHRNVSYFDLTPTCESQAKSPPNSSRFARSYSSNRLRSQISKKSRPRPTSVTSFASPACCRLSGGSRMRPARSSSTSFAREIHSRPTRRSRSSNCDWSLSAPTTRSHAVNGYTSRHCSCGPTIKLPSYCASVVRYRAG